MAASTNSTSTAITRAPAVDPFSGSASRTRDTLMAMTPTSRIIPTGSAIGTSTRSSRRSVMRRVQLGCSLQTRPSHPAMGTRPSTSPSTISLPLTAAPTAVRPRAAAATAGHTLGRATSPASTATRSMGVAGSASGGGGSEMVATVTIIPVAKAPSPTMKSRMAPERSPTAMP